jgi:hypothetical protein
VAKHFSHHYILPSKLLIIPGTVAGFICLVNWKPSKMISYSLLVIGSLFLIFKSIPSVLTYKDGNKVYESFLESKKYSELPKIITTGYQGSSFPESAIRFGACYGGGNFYSNFYFLRKQYPHSYFFDLQLPFNYVKWWDVKLMPVELLAKNPKILIYFRGEEEAREMQMINGFIAGFENAVQSVDLVENKKETGERFYMLNIDTSKINSPNVGKIKIEYDFERRAADQLSFISKDGKFNLGDAKMVTGEQHFSGNNSVKLFNNQYICCTNFAADPGDEFQISVNYFAKDRPVGIALSSNNPSFFDKSSETIINDYGNGWKQAGVSGIIPNDFPENEVRFCLYYYGHDVCYADDLSIVIKKSGKRKKEMADTTLNELHKFILKADDGKYITLTSDLHLIDDQTDESKAEVFERIDLGNGQIAIKASNGQFVCDERNEKTGLIANRKVPQNWETFRITGNELNRINIKSSAGMYVSVDHSSNNILIANKSQASSWETFEVIKKQ